MARKVTLEVDAQIADQEAKEIRVNVALMVHLELLESLVFPEKRASQD